MKNKGGPRLCLGGRSPIVLRVYTLRNVMFNYVLIEMIGNDSLPKVMFDQVVIEGYCDWTNFLDPPDI